MFFLLLAFAVHGQKFHGGINAGLMGTQVTGDKRTGFNKAGLKAGFFVNLPFSARSSVQMELNFIEKGSRSHDSKTGNTYVMRAGYVELPVLYRYHWEKYKFSLEAGLSLATLIYSSELYNDIPVNGPSFHRFDYSWAAGIYYPLRENLELNIRYSYSLLAMRPFYANQTAWRIKGQYHEVLGLSLYYRF